MRKQILLQTLLFSFLFQIKKLFKNELINIMFIYIKRKKRNVFIEKKNENDDVVICSFNRFKIV